MPVALVSFYPFKVSNNNENLKVLQLKMFSKFLNPMKPFTSDIKIFKIGIRLSQT
jgi:hypothetical protein